MELGGQGTCGQTGGLPALCRCRPLPAAAVTARCTHSGFHSAHGDPVSLAPRGLLLSASQVGWGGTHRCDDSARVAGRNSVPHVRRARSSSVLLQATLSSQWCPQDTSPSHGASHCGSKPREERDSAKWGAAVLLVIAWSWHTPYTVLPGTSCPPHTEETPQGVTFGRWDRGHLQSVHTAILQLVHKEHHTVNRQPRS